VQAAELLHEAQEVAAQLGRAVPLLEGEGGAPHAPEVGVEEVLTQQLVDAARAQVLVIERQQAQQLDAVGRVEAVLAGVGDAVLGVDQAGLRVGGRARVEVAAFLAHAGVRVVQRGDAVEEVPGAEVGLVGEHAPATRHPGVGAIGGAATVQRAAWQAQLFKDVDVVARHTGIADGKGRHGHAGDAAADDPEVLVLVGWVGGGHFGFLKRISGMVSLGLTPYFTIDARQET